MQLTKIEKVMAAVDANVIAVTVDLPTKRVNRLAYRHLAGLCNVERVPGATTYRLTGGAGGFVIENMGDKTRVVILSGTDYGLVELLANDLGFDMGDPARLTADYAGFNTMQPTSTPPTSGTGDGQGKGASAEGKRKLEYRAELRQNLTERFNRDELRTLCFDLGIEHENLPETKDGMARELVAYCERTGSISALVAKCKEWRPSVSWDDMPDAARKVW